MGTELIHKITKDQPQQAKIEAVSFSGASVMSKYGRFSVASEDEKYILSIADFDVAASNNTDILNNSNGQKFSTYDEDNDKYSGNCAAGWSSRGGWWYDKCGNFMPNGLWYPESESYRPVEDGWKGMRYGPITSLRTLKSTLMMVKPKDN